MLVGEKVDSLPEALSLEDLTQEGLPGHPSLLLAIGYSIVITSSAGFLFGVLWARTRNFAVLVAAHGMADLLPNNLLRFIP